MNTAHLVMPQPVIAAHLIERNVRNHTIDGYTASHMVVTAHERTIRDLAAQVNEFKGVGLTASRGCQLRALTFGAGTVIAEVEHDKAERATYDHPGSPEAFRVLRVYLNGIWQDAEDVVSEALIERWEISLLEASDDQDDDGDGLRDERMDRALESAT